MAWGIPRGGHDGSPSPSTSRTDARASDPLPRSTNESENLLSWRAAPARLQQISGTELKQSVAQPAWRVGYLGKGAPSHADAARGKLWKESRGSRYAMAKVAEEL